MNRRHKGVLALALLIAGAALATGQGFQVFVGILVMGTALALLVGSDSRIVHTLFLAVGVASVIVPLAIDWATARRETKSYQERLEGFRGRIVSLRGRYPLPDGRTFGVVAEWQLSTKPDGLGIQIGPAQGPWTKYEIVWDDARPNPSFPVPNPPWACYITREARQIIRQVLEGALVRDDVEKLLKPGLIPREILDGRTGFPPATLPADFFDKKERARAVARKALNEMDEADEFPLPEWFEDAVRGGVDPRDIPDPGTPGVAPTPFRFWAALVRNSVLVVPGTIFGGIGLGCLLYFRRIRLGT